MHSAFSNEPVSNRTAPSNVTVIEVTSIPNGNVFTFNGVNEEITEIERNGGDTSNISVTPVNTHVEECPPPVRRPTNIECLEDRAGSAHINGWSNVAAFLRLVSLCVMYTAFSVIGVDASPAPSAADRAFENGTTDPTPDPANVYEHVFLPSSSSSRLQQTGPSSSANTPLSPIMSENKLHSPISSVNMQHSSTPSQVRV